MRRVAFLLALLLAGALSASPAPSSSKPLWTKRVTWSPDGQWIAVSRMPDYGFGVILARPDGSAVKALKISAYRGLWSPDGTRVADSSGSSLVVESVSDGRLDTVGPYPFFGESFDWSPDSEQLVYDADGKLFVVGRDGSGRRELPRGHTPSWSPDGLDVAFGRWTSDGCQSDIAVVGADGSGERTLAVGPEGRVGPVWSPDGSRLAYRSACNESVWVVNRDGSGERLVGDASQSGRFGFPLDWSADGRWLAAHGSWPGRTTLLEVDGSGRASFETSGPATWSPTNDRILFARETDRGAKVFVGSTDGFEREIGFGVSADWSPDGTRIALLRSVYLDTLYAACAEQLLIVDLAGHVRAGLTPCRLEGGSRSDRIVGTPGPDTVSGRRGNDRLYGGMGDDVLSGGEGADRLYGGLGRDRIQAGAGGDRIGTRDGVADRVVCGRGKDVVLADSLDAVDGSCERITRG